MCSNWLGTKLQHSPPKAFDAKFGSASQLLVLATSRSFGFGCCLVWRWRRLIRLRLGLWPRRLRLRLRPRRLLPGWLRPRRLRLRPRPRRLRLRVMAPLRQLFQKSSTSQQQVGCLPAQAVLHRQARRSRSSGKGKPIKNAGTPKATEQPKSGTARWRTMYRQAMGKAAPALAAAAIGGAAPAIGGAAIARRPAEAAIGGDEY